MASQERLFCKTLIVFDYYDFDSYIGWNIQSSSSVIGFDESVYHSLHDRVYFNVVFVLQSCSNPRRILPSSSCDATAKSDCAYHVGNMKAEEDLNMQVVEEELNVKTEKGVGSEEEEWIGINDEESVHSEEEVKEEDVDINDVEDVGIKGEVSLEGTV